MDPRIIERYAALAGQRMVEFNGGQAGDINVLTVRNSSPTKATDL